MTGNICGTTPGFFLGDNNQPQIVLTNYQSVLGPTIPSYVKIDWWQVTPSLSWNFAKDWQARTLVSYGESRTLGIQGGFDTTTANARIASGLINPYNLPASGAGAFDRLFTYAAKIGSFNLLDARVITDGPLPFIHLPGGDIRVAIGAEYIKTDLSLSSTGTVLSPTPSNFVLNPTTPGNRPLQYSQKVKSVFGEVQLPLISADMDFPLVHSLLIAGSARYDKYNDFGDTFNQMAGVTWEPVSWIKIRGNWNTSFAAPNNLTQLATFTGSQLNNVNTTGGTTPLPYFQGITPPGGTNQNAPLGIGAVLNGGTKKGIGPQTSETWSIGAEFAPPFVPGLTFGASYYDLTISNIIATPFTPGAQSLFDFHPELVYCANGVNGSAANAATACATPFSSAELLAANPGYAVASDPVTGGGGLATAASLTTTGVGAGSGSSLGWPTVFANYCEPAAYAAHTCAAGTYTVFYVLDNRATNLGFIYSRGIDFRGAYRTNVPWGSVDASVSGTLNLATKTQAGKGAVVADIQSTGFSKWRMSANLGTTWGGLRAQITWQHSAGYDLSAASIGTIGTSVLPGTGAYGQTHVNPYDTFDLFFRYRFDESGIDNALFKGLTLTLNVNNFMDLDPPVQGGGFANGTTLGRMFMLGLTKEFK